MISLVELNKVVIAKIREALAGTDFAKVPILPLDEADIVRPSFKVNMEGSKLEKINAFLYGRTIATSIYFFASNMKHYRLENMKVQEILESAFIDGIRVADDFYVHIDDIDIDVTDTILICSFSFDVRCEKDEIDDGADYVDSIEVILTEGKIK